MPSLITNSMLNNLEKKILREITPILEKESNISISKASEQLNISPSKLSKFVRRMGFENFKEFKRLHNKNIDIENSEDSAIKNSHLSSIQIFLDSFDRDLVDSFSIEMEKYQNIVLYGAGPSFACAVYFSDRIQMTTHKRSTAVSDMNMLQHYCNQDTLLITLSTSGLYDSYTNLINVNAGEKLFLFEDLITLPELANYKVFYLTRGSKNNKVTQYKRPRTLFFIFLEEVINKLIQNVEKPKKESSNE
ncbi:MurR/RpiR family transcriptional regulator [Vibrio sp. ECSMB14105]|uniref:MurR/RpiR family transcriptional regulator n=1 Tax=Vibrio sp. ECSMB14105 TaxID=1638951 RepID=UPI000619D9BE|nr:MurR/RpiR family transcriptional regulator [Vibrio sp. ECSMB14105]